MTQKFFIVGLPKTGSTWLANMLNEFSSVVCRGEGRFFSSGLRDIPSLCGAIRDATYAWAEFTASRKENWCNHNTDIVTLNKTNFFPKKALDELVDNLTGSAVKHLIDELMESKSGSETLAVGDRTPCLYPNEIDLAMRTFPDAKIVFLHRTIYDFLVSYAMHFYRAQLEGRPDANMSVFTTDDFFQIHDFVQGNTAHIFLESTLDALVLRWFDFDQKFSAMEQLPNVMALRYEDLREETHEKLKQIIKFLDPRIDLTEVSRAVTAWEFGGEKFEQSLLRHHVNDRSVDYGKAVLSEMLKIRLDKKMLEKIDDLG